MIIYLRFHRETFNLYFILSHVQPKIIIMIILVELADWVKNYPREVNDNDYFYKSESEESEITL